VASVPTLEDVVKGVIIKNFRAFLGLGVREGALEPSLGSLKAGNFLFSLFLVGVSGSGVFGSVGSGILLTIRQVTMSRHLEASMLGILLKSVGLAVIKI
jgi:hypothetical protein